MAKIFKDKEDKLTPVETSIPKYNKNLNMICKYKESIRTLEKEVNDLMTQDTSGMTQNAIMERALTVQ